jgi:hypothetical protein
MTVAYEIPPAPHEYVPPPKRPKRTPEDYARGGKLIIGLGGVFFVAGFAYMLHGTTMSPMQVMVATFPLFLIYAGFGWSIWRQGMEGLGPMLAYLSAVLGACGLVAAWLWGQ